MKRVWMLAKQLLAVALTAYSIFALLGVASAFYSYTFSVRPGDSIWLLFQVADRSGFDSITNTPFKLWLFCWWAIVCGSFLIVRLWSLEEKLGKLVKIIWWRNGKR